jgi:hypothetical protein
MLGIPTVFESKETPTSSAESLLAFIFRVASAFSRWRRRFTESTLDAEVEVWSRDGRTKTPWPVTS